MFDPGTIRSARLKRLHGYWDTKRDGRHVPARADLDPIEIPWALGDLSLIEILEPDDFRWRVDGTNLSEYFGCDMTGKRLSEYPYPQYIDSMRRAFRLPVEAKEPAVLIQQFSLQSHRWDYENLLLPLSADGRRIDMLIQMFEIERHQATRAGN